MVDSWVAWFPTQLQPNNQCSAAVYVKPGIIPAGIIYKSLFWLLFLYNILASPCLDGYINQASLYDTSCVITLSLVCRCPQGVWPCPLLTVTVPSWQELTVMSYCLCLSLIVQNYSIRHHVQCGYLQFFTAKLNFYIYYMYAKQPTRSSDHAKISIMCPGLNSLRSFCGTFDWIFSKSPTEMTKFASTPKFITASLSSLSLSLSPKFAYYSIWHKLLTKMA